MSETCCTWLAENTGCKDGHLGTMPQLCRVISSQLRYISTIGKNLLSSNISSTGLYNMVNFGVLAAEIVSLVWDTPANFNGFRILAALLHGTPVLGISQTLRHWTEGTTYIWQGGHHVGHWPTFLVSSECSNFLQPLLSLSPLITWFKLWILQLSMMLSWTSETESLQNLVAGQVVLRIKELCPLALLC